MMMLEGFVDKIFGIKEIFIFMKFIELFINDVLILIFYLKVIEEYYFCIFVVERFIFKFVVLVLLLVCGLLL